MGSGKCGILHPTLNEVPVRNGQKLISSLAGRKTRGCSFQTNRLYAFVMEFIYLGWGSCKC